MADLVAVYFSPATNRLCAHEKATLFDVASMIAKLKGCKSGGSYGGALHCRGNHFLVPDDTLISGEAASLGVCGQDDVFGGVVPYPFVRTKAITHELVSRTAQRPEGWSSTFTDGVRDAVLPGYTAFTTLDARLAGARLLMQGPIRLKKAQCYGGKGQKIIGNLFELDEVLEQLSPRDILVHGQVLEQNLRRATTLSIGQITIDALSMSYHGTQWTTVNNKGEEVYGGSRLTCIRGGWTELERLQKTATVSRAVSQARTYDEVANEYKGFFASRRNYDVGQGFDANGRWRSGVFEASWRSGGASTAELIALTAFAQNLALHVFEASTVKAFGNGRRAPPGAMVHFDGEDPDDGPVLRYTIATQLLRQAAWRQQRVGGMRGSRGGTASRF